MKRLFVVCLLLSLARAASAQSLDLANDDLDSFLWRRHVVSLISQPSAPRSGKLTRFTRLAGMFMGRVSPVSVGSFALCFNLDIK